MITLPKQEIAEALHYADPQELLAQPYEGGFTESTKYILQTPEGSPRFFAKVIDPTNSVEAKVLAAEAAHYESLTGLGLTGEFFPTFRAYLAEPHAHALVIDYLPDTSWGGPWDKENIKKLHKAISGIHAKKAPESARVSIRDTAVDLLEYLHRTSPNTLDDADYARLYEQAWSPDKIAINNSRGQQYFQATPAVYQEVKVRALGYNKHAGDSIIVRDVNLGNIGIAEDRAIFVDPAYLDIGDPSGDMVGLGLNVLLGMPDDETHAELRDHVIQHFIIDRNALAKTVQSLVAIGTLEYSGTENPWMDYHQRMAEVALHTWQKISQEG